MRVCILYAAAGKDDTHLKGLCNAMAKGIDGQGHQVDILDMKHEERKIVSFYDYIIVGTEATGAFGGSIPPEVSQFLARAGKLSGKRCMGFVTKPGMRANKTLQMLMKAMEGEGMYLKNSDILKKNEEAAAVGKRLHIDSK
ncbi:MAG: hypothetical protein LKE40_02345 [Spirochaetia bacterium]|jgi:menaquinone-dependent protoporphyrinogen IX oxidase|nr:hypothetical protein [Spirochaetia bacterium]